MSAIPIPQPRTSGGRPPFEPPVTTTYDSSGGESRDPIYKVLKDGVATLLKHVRNSPREQYALCLRLLEARRDLIEGELRLERMMAPATLPPTIRDLYSMEFLVEDSDAIRTYVRLLDQLEEAFASILAKIEDQNPDSSASDL